MKTAAIILLGFNSLTLAACLAVATSYPEANMFVPVCFAGVGVLSSTIVLLMED